MNELLKKISKDYKKYKSNLFDNINTKTIIYDEVLENYSYDYTLVKELHFYFTEYLFNFTENEIKILLNMKNGINIFIETWYKYNFNIVPEVNIWIESTIEK